MKKCVFSIIKIKDILIISIFNYIKSIDKAINQFAYNYKIFYSVVKYESKKAFYDNAHEHTLYIVMIYYLLFNMRFKIIIVL